MTGAADAGTASLTESRPDSTREQPEPTRAPGAPLLPPARPCLPSSPTGDPTRAARPAWVSLHSRPPNPLPSPTNPSSSAAFCLLRSPDLPWILLPTRVPVGSEVGGAVGAGGSLPNGDRRAETKAAKYQCPAKAAPSPLEPLTRSLGDYPHPEQPRGGGSGRPVPLPSAPGDGDGGRRRTELPGRGGGWRRVCQRGERIGQRRDRERYRGGEGKGGRRGRRLSRFGARRGTRGSLRSRLPLAFRGGRKVCARGGGTAGAVGRQSLALSRGRIVPREPKGTGIGVPGGGAGFGALGCGRAGCRGWEAGRERREGGGLCASALMGSALSRAVIPLLL